MSKVDLKRDVEKRLKNKFGRKHKRDAKLQELEKQLQFAESRCGTLKQQLDYIKLLYGYRKCSEFQLQECLYETSGQGGGDNVNYLNYKEPIKWSKPIERNNNKEESDNRNFINQKGSQSNTTFTNSNSSNKQNWTKEDDRMRGKQKGHLKLLKVKKKYPRKLRKKRRTDDAFFFKFNNASTQTLSQIWQDPVVEIYKNAVVNAESESGMDLFGSNLKKIQKISEIMLDIKKAAEIRDSKIPQRNLAEEEFKAKRSNSLTEKNFYKKKDARCFKEEGIQTEISLEVLISKINFESAKESPNKNPLSVVKPEQRFYEPIKSYCQPTISSKRKQVERDIYSSLNSLNIRNIPFIAAKSTTPSHNIGINIQQVLSIMKKRHNLGNEPVIISNESSTGCNHNIYTSNFFNPKKTGHDSEKVSECNALPSGSSHSKKRPEGIIKSDLSHWISNSDFGKEKLETDSKNRNSDSIDSGLEWTLKVDKLKRVLVFLHEDFASLSHKYKRLQKKLTKRNISKADAKGELGEIEKDLEKKEEEITVVIGLYREVLSLKENLKKLQEKYNLVSCSKAFTFDGLKQSYSAHTQMTILLRKIQNFQDQLKG